MQGAQAVFRVAKGHTNLLITYRGIICFQCRTEWVQFRQMPASVLVQSGRMAYICPITFS